MEIETSGHGYLQFCQVALKGTQAKEHMGWPDTTFARREITWFFKNDLT